MKRQRHSRQAEKSGRWAKCYLKLERFVKDKAEEKGEQGLELCLRYRTKILAGWPPSEEEKQQLIESFQSPELYLGSKATGESILVVKYLRVSKRCLGMGRVTEIQISAF